MIAIGTHALLQKDVQFQALKLIIIDEQHRFGVQQRLALRKKGVAVVFATQSLDDVAASAIAASLIESCPTQVFLPNPRAMEPSSAALYRGFGLNRRQLELIAFAPPKRSYYWRQPRGRRLFDLRLTGVALALCGAGLSALALGVGVAGVAASQAEPPAVSESGPLHARPWSPGAVAEARAAGQPVLVNFTADWCVTCKVNESTALSSARTAETLEQANAVYLVGDWTRRDDAITAELQRHGRSGVPLYLVYAPGRSEPRILPQLLTEGLVVNALPETRR